METIFVARQPIYDRQLRVYAYELLFRSNASNQANIALLGFGLTSDVPAGENAGRELTHDFVVLEYARATMSIDDGSYEATTRRLRTKVNADRYAIALWVSTENEQTPLQAVGAWLDH